VKGERTEPLASRHPADQALVASEERCLRVTDLLAGARGALGRLGHSNTSCGRTCLVPGPLGGTVISSSAHPLGVGQSLRLGLTASAFTRCASPVVATSDAALG